MQITIRLFGSLRDILPRENRGKTTIELPSNATVQDALDQLGIAEHVLVSINEEHESDTQSPLQAGDKLLIFEASSGG